MMFFSGETVASDIPKLGSIKIKRAKALCLRRTQELFLEGRQINALYICTHDELRTAEKRKLDWHTSIHDLFEQLFDGSAVIDFFDEISINVLRDSEPIETLSEQFHNELNQRLERLRIIRRAIEDAADVADSAGESAAVDQQIEAAAQEMELEPEPAIEEKSPILRVADSIQTDEAPKRSRPVLDTTKIILVLCSRNGTARQALCRFASQMNLSFEIVDYNPDQPHGLVDQLYHHRDAKFAVVYWGEPTGKELPGSAHPERYAGFALGFALGRLGRGRVFILGSTTTPPVPGFTRILVSQLDSSGGWQIQLARRMKAAGVNIDLNLLT